MQFVVAQLSNYHMKIHLVRSFAPRLFIYLLACLLAGLLAHALKIVLLLLLFQLLNCFLSNAPNVKHCFVSCADGGVNLYLLVQKIVLWLGALCVRTLYRYSNQSARIR